MNIRIATEDDAPFLVAIYAPYVRETAVTFEYEVPDEDEFRSRIRATLEKYPYFVCELEGKIAGYAYAGAFKERAAYSWSAETSLYVDKSFRRAGIGSALLEKLESTLFRQNVLNANACIAQTDRNDEYLTDASILFHKKKGYRMAGKFSLCGYKFGRWYNMVWMEKMLGEHKSEQPDFIPFPELEFQARLYANDKVPHGI